MPWNFGDSQLSTLFAPAIQALGLDVWVIDLVGGKQHTTLRVYIDSPTGVTIDHCEQVSRQLSSILDVEDPLPGHYYLEVSSPGIDRPLFTQAHYQRYLGHCVSLRLKTKIADRKYLSGQLVSVQQAELELTTDQKDQTIKVPFSVIAKANLVTTG
jgi:ribosome maturation factor RimP